MGACKSKDKNVQSQKVKDSKIATETVVKKEVIVIKDEPEIIVQKSKAVLPTNNIKKINDYKIRFTLGGNEILNEGTYSGEKPLKLIIEEFRQKLDPYSEYDYHIIDTMNNQRKDISNRQMENISAILTNEQAENIVNMIDLKYAGLNISPDTRKAYAESTFMFATPKYDQFPFELITFNKTTNGLAYQVYQDETFNHLKVFNEFSAYCNGMNKFFISGSDKKNEDDTYTNLFMEVDLTNMAKPDHMKRLPNLITGRGWHSMIFVPPCYVFIVGGINTNTVELYNSETGQLTHDSTMLEQRSETSLCCVNNTFLYAFCGFLLNNNFLNSIEKCNLKIKNRSWEKVNLNLSPNCIFEPSFFSIAYGKGNSIILLGGKENQRSKSQNYILDVKDGMEYLDNYQINLIDDFYLCSEKFFIPMNEMASLLMPVHTSDVVKILLFDSDKDIISVIKFEIMDTTEDDIRNSNTFQDKFVNNLAGQVENVIDIQPGDQIEVIREEK